MNLYMNTVAEVNEDRTVTLKAPDAVPVGPCRVTVVFKPGDGESGPPDGQFTDGWPTYDVGLANPNETFRREDMYGDDGR